MTEPDEDLLVSIVRDTLEENGPPPATELADLDQVDAHLAELAGALGIDLGDVAIVRAVLFGAMAPGLILDRALSLELGVETLLEDEDDGLEKLGELVPVVACAAMVRFDNLARHG